jgi:hypothetical protein
MLVFFCLTQQHPVISMIFSSRQSEALATEYLILAAGQFVKQMLSFLCKKGTI